MSRPRCSTAAGAKALVQQQFQGYYTANPAASFAAQVWTNNVWVAAQSLIYGILLGIPTIFVLLENAVNGGVNAGYLFAHGKGTLFFSLILPHGMLELSGVFLAAAAGLRLGSTKSGTDPGDRRRGQALAEEGRSTVTITIGLIAVLGVSGLIEAFVTPSHLATWARIGIGAVALIAFLGYALGLGKRAVRGRAPRRHRGSAGRAPGRLSPSKPAPAPSVRGMRGRALAGIRSPAGRRRPSRRGGLAERIRRCASTRPCAQQQPRTRSRGIAAPVGQFGQPWISDRADQGSSWRAASVRKPRHQLGDRRVEVGQQYHEAAPPGVREDSSHHEPPVGFR